MNHTCEVDGCDRPAEGTSVACKAHRARMRRTGSYGPAVIEAPATRLPRGASLSDRLLAFSEIDPITGCRIWNGTLQGAGYGLMRLNNPRRQSPAHRVAYETWVGPIPDGMQIDHLCHNADPDCLGSTCRHRRCILPTHLEPVTPRENLVRAPLYRGNVEKRKTHCPQGHAYTPENITWWHNERRCLACGRERSQAWYAARKG